MNEANEPSSSNILRPDGLDEVDHTIVSRLSDDARMTNAELAAHAGVAPSTAHLRLKGLLDRGIIGGFHASIDQHALGRGLHAIIGVALRPGSRQESITAFAEDVGRLPPVIQLFFLGGADDFIMHVAVEDSSALRAFVVEHLSAQRSVASTRTNIVFEYQRNSVVTSFR
ncbi:MAG: AsnC family transcriptional regulator [Leifsonia xyli]|nr:MAG: AsnC family transcriptional regulator [Leifsonia xyli]